MWDHCFCKIIFIFFHHEYHHQFIVFISCLLFYYPSIYALVFLSYLVLLCLLPFFLHIYISFSFSLRGHIIAIFSSGFRQRFSQLKIFFFSFSDIIQFCHSIQPPQHFHSLYFKLSFLRIFKGHVSSLCIISCPTSVLHIFPYIPLPYIYLNIE